MADAFLDTTVFIDYVRGDVAAKALLEPFISQARIASYSPITVAEIWCGEGMKERKQEIEYEAILQTMMEAPLTGSIARQAGSWLRAYGHNQQRELFADALIAATAAEQGVPIHTRNDKHMKRFYGNTLTY